MDFLEKRSYRRNLVKNKLGSVLIPLMEKAYLQGFSGYWERFGYEIGGPVCYAYTKWVAEQIDSNPEITDIAFVARDGWLLKQIYEKISRNDSVNVKYVYAPRSLTIAFNSPERASEYKDYTNSLGFGDGTLAVIDTVTMKFSSQRLLSRSTNRKTLGFYWVVLNQGSAFREDYPFRTYQKKDFHTIHCWNLMEFIMTSPESPVSSIQGGLPVFARQGNSEQKRQSIFHEIESGVMRFVVDLFKTGELPYISNKFITKWVNGFLRYPDDEDKQAFAEVLISERADHSDAIKLAPFDQDKNRFRRIKERLWFVSQRHRRIYAALHAGNEAVKRLQQAVEGRSYVRYDGSNPAQMAERLAGYDVVSFDIFDTLIKRPVSKPTDLFYNLEKANGLLNFHDNRILAEADARQVAGGNGEVDIFAIYELLAARYHADPVAMAQIEIDEEIKECLPVECVKELYNVLKEKRVRMIAVSDMYLPSRYLRKMLDKCGYSEIEEIYVSCEYGVGKSNGELQRRISQELGTDVKVIHIGDNLYSDVRGTLESEWAALWYKKE